jgi:hypothetical protein
MTFLDMVSRYMAERYVRFEEGQIWFGKERVTFNFIPILARELIINSKINGPRFHATLFISARREGYDFMKEHAIPLVRDWTPGVKMGFEWINLFGVGSFRPIKANNKEGFTVTIGVSTLGLEMKLERPGGGPVDFVMCGLISGAIEYYTRQPTYGIETSCVAEKGVDQCTLVAGTRKNITEYVQKFSPDKLEHTNNAIDQIQAVEEEIRQQNDERWLV